LNFTFSIILLRFHVSIISGGSLALSAPLATALIEIRFIKKLKKYFKELAKELLRYYRNNYEMVDCPDIVGYNELQENASHIIDRDCFELVIIELVNMGEVSVGSSKDGDKVLKFKVRVE